MRGPDEIGSGESTYERRSVPPSFSIESAAALLSLTIKARLTRREPDNELGGLFFLLGRPQY